MLGRHQGDGEGKVWGVGVGVGRRESVIRSEAKGTSQRWVLGKGEYANLILYPDRFRARREGKIRHTKEKNGN